MEGELQTVFDDQYTDEALQKDQQKPEERVTRSRTTQSSVLEYKTFTRSYNHNSTYLNSLLKTTEGRLTNPTKDQIGNFILNVILPLPMAGSMVKISRRRIKEEKQYLKLKTPVFKAMETIAGSSAEGLGLPQITHMGQESFSIEAPDDDTKFVFSELIVGSQKSSKTLFAFIDRSHDGPPSFVQLRLNNDFLARFGKRVEMIKGLSSTATENSYINRNKLSRLLRLELKEYIRNESKEMKEFRCKEGHAPNVKYSHNGPAVTVEITDELMNVVHSKDYVISLPCPKWPNQAKGWINRRRVWPSNGIILKVVKEGCHVVPKASKQGRSTEFLLSFSMCDRTICQSLNSNQKRCFMLFKLVFKYHLNKVKRGLSSYFCKLVFLWLCEKKHQDEWREDNPLECLVLLLSDFKDYLSRHFLPNYYIPEHNMLSDLSVAVVRACEKDVERVLENPWQVVLDISEKHRFIWLSRDVSLTNCLSNLLNMEMSWELMASSVLSFLSLMLDKGEVHLVLSILCEKWACDILPETSEAIRALEQLIANHSEDENIVCFKGLLANLYHNIYHEEEEPSMETGRWLGKSLDLYRDILKEVDTHTWIYGAYYDLLYTFTAYGDLIQHFLTKVHPKGSRGGGRLLEDGIYTAITPHNNLTSEDRFANLSKLFVVPSAAYIIYKIVQAYMALSREKDQMELKLAYSYKNEATKVVQYLDKWVKRKSLLYPESTDDYLYFLLGKAACEVRDMNIVRKAFKEACSYGTSFACIQFSNEANSNDVDMQVEDKAHRYHPYRRKKSRQTETLPKDMKFLGMDVRVGPFLHN